MDLENQRYSNIWLYAGQMTTMRNSKQFDFVFYISLKEKMILEQHLGLRTHDVDPDEIKEVLKNNDGCKTLLLIDEYDQYQRCSNTSVDDVIEKRSLQNSQILLSSRETQQIKNIRKYLDDEIELQGIDEVNIQEYINGSLADKNKGTELSKRVEEIMKLTQEEEWIVSPTPSLVNMICISVMTEGPKPKSKTEAVQDLVNKYLDRESIRATGRKTSTRLQQQTIDKLAKLSWEGLKGLAGENYNFPLVKTRVNFANIMSLSFNLNFKTIEFYFFEIQLAHFSFQTEILHKGRQERFIVGTACQAK